MKTKIMNLFSMMESAESAESAKSIFATFANANFVCKESDESTVRYRVKSRIASTMARQWLENGSTKLHKNLGRIVALLCLLMTLSIGNVWGADITTSWTATSGALGTGIGSGTINTTVSGTGTTQSWSYTRTLSSGSSYTGWTSNCIQLGKNGGVENLTLSTSNIPGTIKSVSVECSSYQGKHNVSITVGSTTYLSSTATASWTTVNAKSGTGTSSGTITISFTGGTRALYIKSISVTYNNDGAPVTYGVTYNANGDGAGNATGTYGSVPTDNTSYSSGASVTVAGRGTLGKVGHSFAGWNTAANGSGTPYAAGATFSISANTTLYAQWTNTYAGDEFSLVEDLSEISAGSKIIILDEDHATAMSTNQASNNRASVAASADGGFTLSNSNKTVTLKSATTVQIITLEDLATPVSNRYQFNVENGYLYAASSGSNYMRTQTTNDANGHWQISLTSGTFGVVAQGSNTYNVLQKNSSSTLYSCYNSASQKNVLLYVKEEGTKYAITWNKNGHGTAPTSPTNASKVTLPDISVTGYTNTGWKANVAVTNASTSASISAGTLITPGTRVQLGAATTFTAQWENATYTISSTLTNCSSSPAIPSSYTYTGSAAGLSYTITPSSGFALPSSITVSGTTYTWDNTTGALSLTGTIESNVSITITAQRLYTVTFSKGTGTCATTSLQGTNADGITLPTPTHSCSSEGWSFAGWTTGSLVTSETTTAPATLYTGGSNYKPSSNITLYAVYQKGDGKYHKITSTPETIPGKYVIANVTAGQAIKNATISGYSYYLAAQSVIISSNEIASPDASCVWDVTYESSKWIFKNGSNYFYNIYESSHHNLKLNSTKPSGYSVSFSGDIATLASADDDGYHVIYYYYSGGSTHEFKSSADGDNLTLFRLDKIYYSNPTCCSNKITIGTPSVTGIGTVTFTYGGDAVVAGDEIETCDDDIEIIATVTPASGYACSELSFTGGSVAVSPTIGAGNRPAYPSSQEYTLSFTSGTNATLSTSVTFTAKTLSSISLSPSSGEVYVGQYVDFTVSYDPADYISQGYILNATPTYVAKESAAPAATKLRLKGGRGSGPGASITTTVNETVTIKASGDNTKTASVSMTVNPLPYVTFVDHVHNKTDFTGMTDGKVTEEIVANALSGTKTTPTHADIAAPGSGSDCEKSHLHLVGWILSTWADANPTASGATITGAGAGNFYAAGASIDIAAQNGKTYYAVWSKIE